MSTPFIGEIRIFAGNFAIRDWAMCNGQLLPIAQNTALFSLLGTTYGGDGRTTFALPNLSGRMPIHRGNGPGLTPRFLGEQGGTQTVTLLQSQMPAHGHSGSSGGLRVAAGPPNRADPRGNSLAAATVFNNLAPDVEMSDAFGDDLAAAGGAQAHNNMSPYLTLNFIIALTGLYPPRS